MATKQQTGSSAIHYEDFQPKTEWKEEEEANMLLVHLPGFLKEQISVSYVHSSRIVRILGERPLENTNKWSRFNQAFPVPKNCAVEKIKGSFKYGILTVRMPKETITKVTPKPEPTKTPTDHKSPLIPPKSDTASDKPKPPKGTQKNASTTVSNEQRDQELPKPTKKGLQEEETTAPKQPITSSIIPREKETDNRRRVVPLGPQKAQPKSQDTVPPKINASSSTMKQADEKKEIKSDTNVKAAAESRRKKDTNYEEKESSTKKSIELNKMGRGGFDDDDDQIKSSLIKKDKKDSTVIATKEKELKNVAAAAVKSVKGLTTMESSEERQLMVNMGLAVLVIVALGAYISYSFRSSGKTRH